MATLHTKDTQRRNMARDKKKTIIGEMFSFEYFKRNLGKTTRRATAGAIALIFILGAYSFSTGLGMQWSASLKDAIEKGGSMAALYSALLIVVQYVIPGFLAIGGSWFGFRVVQYPPFADFLIAVEAEMTKVTWPDRTHLFRGTVVVLSTMFILTMAMFVYDLVWQAVFRAIGFLNI
jgi:preprotein translocase subunit SecE